MILHYYSVTVKYILKLEFVQSVLSVSSPQKLAAAVLILLSARLKAAETEGLIHRLGPMNCWF